MGSAILLILFCFPGCHAPVTLYAKQSQGQAATARRHMQAKEFEKAIPILKNLYEQAPFDQAVYTDYLEALLQTRRFPEADNLIRYMMQIRRGDPVMLVDLGRVEAAAGNRKKAREHYQHALTQIDGSELQVKKLAGAFEQYGLQDYAIQTYELARELIQNPYAYATELSLLYSKAGRTKDAISALLDMVMIQQNILDEIKTSLLRISEDNKKGISLIQKELEARVEEQPENPYWQELISWTFIQSADYEGAFLQLRTLDEKLNEQGARILHFAKNAAGEGHYPVAQKAFDYILALGKEQPFYALASAGKLNMLRRQFEDHYPGSGAGLEELLKAYSRFFTDFPQYKHTDMWRDYARLYARYQHDVPTAITLLNEVTEASPANDAFTGRCKLDLGDYLLLAGRVWEASLTYSQVDKAFRQDILGEEARFRNAKLAYYRGDFLMAQEQLSVLKASTTELIANDALYLSVLITENMPPDSNLRPLLRFAAADLLLFQHKTSESDQLLDSISKAYPQSPLQDDILLLRARIAMQEERWPAAVLLLETVINQYGNDVLGDDAAFKLAGIFQHKLNNPAKASAAYELLISRYPGSTYVQKARKQYAQLEAEKVPDT